MPRPVFLLLGFLVLSACSLTDAACGAPTKGTAPVAITGEAAPDPATNGKITITFLGDSLTAGLGLLSNQAYPAQLGLLFEADGYANIEIDDAGLSGDTSAGGLRRVEQDPRHRPRRQ
jgi:lysophospholipase L1-like esterase